MKTKRALALCALLLIFTMACGLPNPLKSLGGDSAGTVSQLWPDVPEAEGLTKADLDLPLTARLAIQGFVKSSTKGDAALDFISYTTSQPPQNIFDYYTPERMADQGWNMKDQPGCTSGQSSSGGAGVCLYGKDNGDSSGSFLAIFVAADAKTEQTNVFFIRADAKNLPTPQP